MKSNYTKVLTSILAIICQPLKKNFTSLFRTQPIQKVKAKSKITSYKAGVFRAWRQWHITALRLFG